MFNLLISIAENIHYIFNLLTLFLSIFCESSSLLEFCMHTAADHTNSQAIHSFDFSYYWWFLFSSIDRSAALLPSPLTKALYCHFYLRAFHQTFHLLFLIVSWSQSFPLSSLFGDLLELSFSLTTHLAVDIALQGQLHVWYASTINVQWSFPDVTCIFHAPVVIVYFFKELL